MSEELHDEVSGLDEDEIAILRARSGTGYASKMARAVKKRETPDAAVTPGQPMEPINRIGQISSSIRSFVEGNERFRKIHFQQHEQALMDSIQKGQRPKALFMSCCDSRVLPDAMMQVKAGDLFVSRNIGGFVAPYTKTHAHAGTTSVIQYAVTVLEVQEIIVCTHSHCGACAALYNIEGVDTEECAQLAQWLKLGEKARDLATSALPADAPRELLLRTTEKLVAVVQLEHLMTHPYVKRRMEAGKLFLHAWHYSIETGELQYYDSVEHDFKPLQDQAEKDDIDRLLGETL